MNGGLAVEEPTSGVHAGGTAPPADPGALARFAKAVTPNLRSDPRTALRDMRVREPLRSALAESARRAGLSLEDGSADDPYADTAGNTLQRQFSLLRSASDEVVLLQIPDWVADDGANIGALTEIRDAVANRKVRIIAENVLTPDRSLEKTMPKIWRATAKIDLEFVSWRYVMDVQQGKRSPVEVFGLATDGAAAAPAPAAGKTIKRVFISSTSKDLALYREAARDACLELQFMPIMMEYFEAMGLGATAGSKKKLDQADLYVGIFAHRYGYVEKDYDKSVTEIEFDYAAERSLERLCFVADPAHPWPPATLDPEHHVQMTAFKNRVGTLIRGQFTTVDNLKAQVLVALVPHRP